MGGSVADVPQEGVSRAATDAWVREIRDYLLGRLSARARTEPIATTPAAELPGAPIRRWWILEGKQHEPIGGSLAGNWDAVLRLARRLDETFNPRLRLSDRADGDVDWERTLARGPLRSGSEYVVRSSGVGLNEAERAALRGWRQWIGEEWLEYTGAATADPRLEWRDLSAEGRGSFTEDRLRRWAHTARRSRWPLLREVVANSIRPMLEPAELDRIPLPSEPSQLFELLCLVRIARRLAPVPRDIRWVDKTGTNNTVRLHGVTCYYQQALDRHVVLAAPDYAGALATAIDLFGVGIPHFVDLAFDFDEPRTGFDGLIVEVKSGTQPYRNAVAQLRTYRAARRRRPGSRYLVWAIVEGPSDLERTRDQVKRVLAATDNGDDVWLFSSADAIDAVLDTVFGRPVECLGNAPAPTVSRGR